MEQGASIHPAPAPNSQHRKIELQSPQDLAYLQNNLVASARQQLDLQFPLSALQDIQAQPATVISLDGVKGDQASESLRPNEHAQQEEDPLRARVRQLVDAFVARTWDGAAQNITVNGMDGTSFPFVTETSTAKSQPHAEREGVDFVYEPYDTRLQAKVAGLYGELETLTAQVSRLRRTAPKQGTDTFRDRLTSELAGDEAEFGTQMAAARDKATGAKLNLHPLREGWHQDVRATYERGTAELAALAGFPTEDNTAAPSPPQPGPSLTETVGKVQRARTVAMEFE
jgi:kinetochor protein Mis14/NSL1